MWDHPELSKRDRRLVTVAALVSQGHIHDLPSHLRRAIANGVTKTELSVLLTHLAFYVGFPAPISASAVAVRCWGCSNPRL